MDPAPVVSVLMPVSRQHANDIQPAIESILHQTFPDYELLIAGDTSCSTSLVNRLASYRDQRISYIPQTPGLDRTSPLQRALALARGALLARCDPEDISDPDRLRVQVDFLRHNPEVGVVGSQANLIDSRNSVVGYVNVLQGGEYIDRAIHLFNPVLPQTAMFRRSVVEQCGGFRFGASEHYDLVARLFAAGARVANLPLGLVSYRLGSVGRCPELPSLLFDVYHDSSTGNPVQKRAILRGNLCVKRQYFRHQFRLIDRLYDCYERCLLTIPRDWIPSAEWFARRVLDGLSASARRRARRRFTRDGRATVPGITLPVQVRPGTSDVQVFQQVLGQCEYGFRLTPTPETIVDGGANIGLTSVYFANRYPRSRILAIEPDPDNYRLLRQNCEPYPNITPINAALWPKDEPLSMQNTGQGSWALRVNSATTPEREPREGLVRCVTMERLISEYGFRRLDLLKLDIEGAEKHLLDSHRGWLDRVDAIMIETHDRFMPGCTRSLLQVTRQFTLVSCRGEVALFVRTNGPFCSVSHSNQAVDESEGRAARSDQT